MNRAIKYRLWDSHKKEYWEPTYEAYKGNLEDITLSKLGQLIMRTLDGTNPIPIISERFVIEQFTGKKDKTGKDIYEGDLIEFDELIFEVKWNNESASFGLYQDGKESDTLDGCEKYMEVVGNIHVHGED